MHNDCKQDVVSDAPWMFVGMSQQASTQPMFSEMGLKVAWDEEMQFESHTHEGLLQQLAQGGEVLDKSAEEEGEVVEETSRSDVTPGFEGKPNANHVRARISKFTYTAIT
jgi:hypothetical protein